jgi:hypothetical protein
VDELGPGRLSAYHVLRPGDVERIAAGPARIFYSSRTAARVYVATDAGPKKILGGAHLVAYDGTTLIVRRGSSMQLAGPDGHAIDTVRIAGHTPADALVDGAVAVTVDAAGVLREIDARTGAVERTFAAVAHPADPPQLEDLDSTHAALVADGVLYVVRLSDGHAVRIDIPGAVAPIHARFAGGLLAVSYNALGTAPYGRVALVPIPAIGG